MLLKWVAGLHKGPFSNPTIKPDIWDLLTETFFRCLSPPKTSAKPHLFISEHSVLHTYVLVAGG